MTSLRVSSKGGRVCSASSAPKPSAFGLKLANGQSWCLVGSDAVASWLGRLAKILGLQHSDMSECARLVFVEGRNGMSKSPVATMAPDLAVGLPVHGWHVQDCKAVRLWSHDAVPDVICELGQPEGHEIDIIRMWICLRVVYARALAAGGIWAHTALIARGGHAVMLAAHGGGGKSTTCRRLVPPWRWLADDQALLVLDQQGRYVGHPLPTWSDHLMRRASAGHAKVGVEATVLLRAMLFLEQATSDELVPIGQGEAAMRLYEAAHQAWAPHLRDLDCEHESAMRRQLFESGCGLAKITPAFVLKATLDGYLHKHMDKALRANLGSFFGNSC